MLLAVSASQGIESDLIPRIATGMGGGISNTGHICGALSGAVMSLGILLGRDTPEGSKEDIQFSTRKLMETFIEKYGSTNCEQLLQCQEDMKARANGREQSEQDASCETYVVDAVMMTLEFVAELNGR